MSAVEEHDSGAALAGGEDPLRAGGHGGGGGFRFVVRIEENFFDAGEAFAFAERKDAQARPVLGHVSFMIR
jgi:hypothetical protein